MKKQTTASFLYRERYGFALMNGAFLALGIGVYFSLPVEPNLWAMGLLAFIASVIWFLGHRDAVARVVLGYICLFCVGLFVATVRADVVAAPVISDKMFDTAVSGIISKVEPKRNGFRITLENVWIDGVEPDRTPAKIRLNYAGKTPLMRVGDSVKGYAHLMPPILPAEHGAYDFSRTAWFMQIGAIGRLSELKSYSENPNRSALKIWFEDLRSFISERVQQILPADAAAIAVPLIIGDQGLVSPEQYELYRIAGIIHVLSVSGFHLTLLAGLVFFLIRGIFALVPRLGSVINTKKLAAFLSLLLVLFYLFISGLQIPAVRSFIMIAVVLTAVMFDRSALSLRTAVLAGALILLIWPESLINAGFQLSFIAVFAMLSLYEILMRVFKDSPYKHNFFYKCWLIFVGSVCVSLLATLSTALYGMYHFNQFAPYGVLGNLLTSALFSFAIMPLLLAAVLLMPFGWDALFLKGTGACLTFIGQICEWIKNLPYADVTIASFDTWGLGVITAGLLILFFFQSAVRLIGIPIIALGLFSFMTVERPDILVSEGGKVFAVRLADGRLSLSDRLANPLISDTWLRRNGQNPNTDVTPEFLDNFVVIGGKKIAFSSLACADADLSILTSYEMGDCPKNVIKLSGLWKNKTHAVFVSDGVIRVENVAEGLGLRPWHKFLLAQPEKSDYTGE